MLVTHLVVHGGQIEVHLPGELRLRLRLLFGFCLTLLLGLILSEVVGARFGERDTLALAVPRLHLCLRRLCPTLLIHLRERVFADDTIVVVIYQRGSLSLGVL